MVDLEFSEEAWKAESNGAHFSVLSVATTTPVTADPADQIPTQPEPRPPRSPELCPQRPRPGELTRIVVMMSVLFASVSETLMSRLVEFMAKVLLEYQIPI